jgi:putative hydrolase of the HAD superfamily
MRQSLFIDADDTLWENNVYFEQAFAEFVEFLDHSRLDAHQVRAVLDEIEIANNKIHGYGSLNFGRNLVECYRHLAERHIREDDLRRVMAFAERILEAPMELIEGVAETLEYLSPRHELTLFTKGHPDEQRMKIDRSGLERHFAHTAIVKEKNVNSYRRLVEERGCDPGRTWMIGNSPKSDINPALAAGLNAVYVPHSRTWTLEREELRRDVGQGMLVEVISFSELKRWF